MFVFLCGEFPGVKSKYFREETFYILYLTFFILPFSSDHKVGFGSRLIVPLNDPTYTRLLFPADHPTDLHHTGPSCPSRSSADSAPASPTCASDTHLPRTPPWIPIPNLDSRCPGTSHDFCSPSSPNASRSPSRPHATELPCPHQGKDMDKTELPFCKTQAVFNL